MMGHKTKRWPTTIAIGLGAAMTASIVAAKDFTAWNTPVSAESLAGSSADLNTASNDGCPILSPYDDSLYIASNRPGGQGGLDIWMAHRSGDGWGTPVNLGPAINTAADEFCPSPSRGNRLFFVRRLSATNTEVYVAKHGPKGWTGVANVGPGVNSSAEEWSPSWFETNSGDEVLYFSSTREGRQRIYYSVNFGPASLASGGVNTVSDSDARPNVRHDGLEIVWDSTRAGSLGGPDVWTATRSSTSDPWGTAVHLVAQSSAGNDTRASLSWDGTRLMVGSTRSGSEGSADVYTSTRTKITGSSN